VIGLCKVNEGKSLGIVGGIEGGWISDKELGEV